MHAPDAFTTSLVAACAAMLMVHAGIGKRMLVWRVAAGRRRRRRRPADRRQR